MYEKQVGWVVLEHREWKQSGVSSSILFQICSFRFVGVAEEFVAVGEPRNQA
jgi:hypothetical protein